MSADPVDRFMIVTDQLSLAIAGVGSQNAENVPVDALARMDTTQLREKLMKCASEGRAVYEVVAVVGTTEEGAVDRVTELIQIRDDMRAEGLSFILHAGKLVLCSLD